MSCITNLIRRDIDCCNLWLWAL